MALVRCIVYMQCTVLALWTVAPFVLRCGVGGNCLGPSLTIFPRIGWLPFESVQGLTAVCVSLVSRHMNPP
jgi:hypothetical protein